jgi:small subunit ribosomal protein S29
MVNAANFSSAQDFVINQSSYAPLPRPKGSQEDQEYIQPHLTAELLTRIASSNQPVLEALTLNLPLPQKLSTERKPQNLHALASLGAENPNLAHQTWTHLYKELTSPGTQPRPPTLFAIDGLDHWMCPTKYRSADYHAIHPHQFTLIKQFLSLLFTDTTILPYGGMVIAATTKSNNPVSPSLDLLLKQTSALNEGLTLTSPDFPMPSPYAKLDPRILSLLPSSPSITTVTNLKGLSKHEAKGLLEYYNNSGLLKDHISEGFLGEKWTMSGGGVIGELCRLGKTMMVDPEKEITVFGTNEGVGRGQGEHVRRG